MRLTAGSLAGASARLDGFMNDLTFAQLRGTVTMGYVLNDEELRHDSELAFDTMLPVFTDLALEWTGRRRAGVSSLEIGLDYAGLIDRLTQGARLMTPHFPRRDVLSDADLELLYGLQAAQHVLIVV
jgi:hypothetical protein